MKLSRNESASVERRLIKYLTQACEAAKFEIDGFVWLDHVVDYADYPRSLQVSWAFASVEQRDRAASGPVLARIREFTEIALTDAGVPLEQVADPLRLIHERQG